ncbi:MAG: cupredoxin domain-containing protein [Gammaproteobacteria bacterium]|nr:MAG: cupredoxin domain-containing protein [Gammaproteobacteria bacterium]RLA20689.1 MAG: cupredoxin domain-containing protein [Gammaproteobacteria bacterium]
MVNYSKRLPFILATLLSVLSPLSIAGSPIIEIEIRNHLFFPDVITIPADTKIKLMIYNRDNSSEEFESYELNREKIIPGKSRAVIFIGPLPAGEYPFFGEFFPKTAQGKVVVK